MSPDNNIHDEETRNWTSRSIGSKLQHRIFYLFIRTGGSVLAYGLLYFVVLYYTLFRPSVRRTTRFYLSIKYPGKGIIGRFTDSYLMMLNLGKVLVDRAITGILGPDKMVIEFNEKQELHDLLDEGKGLILLMSHVGCWQVALSALSFLKRPVNMLMHREDGDIDKQYFEHAHTECPYHIIDPRGYLGGVMEMMGVLKNGEVLGIMGDRSLGSEKNVVRVDFLGKKAPFPISCFKLASATGTPVAVMFSHKTEHSGYKLTLGKTIRVPKDLGRSCDNFRPYVEQYVTSLEEYTKEHPYQFFNFYDMWI